MDVDFHEAGDLPLNRKHLFPVFQDQFACLFFCSVSLYQVMHSLLERHNRVVHHPLVGIVDDFLFFDFAVKIQVMDYDMLLHNLCDVRVAKLPQEGSPGSEVNFVLSKFTTGILRFIEPVKIFDQFIFPVRTTWSTLEKKQLSVKGMKSKISTSKRVGKFAVEIFDLTSVCF